MISTKEIELQFRLLYRPLGMYALRILGDIDEAEDTVQQVFKSIIERRESLEIGNFRMYVYKAVRNEAVLRIRNSRSDIMSEEALETVNEEIIDTSIRDAVLWQQIDRLPARRREVLLLSKREGLSNKEIASQLGISVKTVENQMTHALRSLRKALGNTSLPVFFLPFL